MRLPKRTRAAMAASLLFFTSQLTSQALLASDTLTIEVRQLPVSYPLEATLEAVNQSTIAAQTPGTVKEIRFDVNDRVEQGALLIRIDDTQQRAAVMQAQANLAQARAQNDDAQALLRRNSRLFAQGTLSQGELDSTKARAKSAAATVNAAQAALQQANEQLAYTRVSAPYSGIVKARHVEIGETVAPGTPLMTGLSLQRLRAVADVPQRLAPHTITKEHVSIAINGQTLTPQSVTVFPYADPQHRSVRLRADLPATQSGLMPGMWATVIITQGQRPAIVVPESAVIRRSELSAVYVQHHGKALLRQVRVGNPQANQQLEILSGLNAGDVIYIDGYGQLAADATHPQ